MLGDPFNFLSNWPTYIWLRNLPNDCSPIGGLYRIPSVRKAINSLTKAKNMLLFGSNQILAMDYCLIFYPNQENFRYMQSYVSNTNMYYLPYNKKAS